MKIDIAFKATAPMKSQSATKKVKVSKTKVKQLKPKTVRVQKREDSLAPHVRHLVGRKGGTVYSDWNKDGTTHRVKLYGHESGGGRADHEQNEKHVKAWAKKNKIPVKVTKSPSAGYNPDSLTFHFQHPKGSKVPALPKLRQLEGFKDGKRVRVKPTATTQWKEPPKPKLKGIEKHRKDLLDAYSHVGWDNEHAMKLAHRAIKGIQTHVAKGDKGERFTSKSSAVAPQKVKISIAAGEDRPQPDDNVLALVPGAADHPAYADAVQACRDENIDPESSIGIARINKAISEYDQADGGDDVSTVTPAGNRANTEDAVAERDMAQVDGTSISASGNKWIKDVAAIINTVVPASASDFTGPAMGIEVELFSQLQKIEKALRSAGYKTSNAALPKVYTKDGNGIQMYKDGTTFAIELNDDSDA